MSNVGGKAGSGSGGSNAGRGGTSGRGGGGSGGAQGGSGNFTGVSAGDSGQPGAGAGGTLCDCANGSCDTGTCICDLGWTGGDCNDRLASCAALLAAFPSAPSDTYEIDPDGAGGPVARFDAYCDMEFDGGGWTLVMGTNALGPVDQTEGVVAPGSGSHLPSEWLVALAAEGVSSQVHIRTSGQPDIASITSVPDSLPIGNLRGLHVLNDNSGIYSSSATVTDWTGPYATAYHLWHSCGPLPYEGVPGYPNIWWSCNNGGGLHIASVNSGWNAEPLQNQDMEVYVR